MILHVTFSNGSNPWVSFPGDRHEIKKHWRRWMKYHPLTATPRAYSNSHICELASDFSGYWVWKRGDYLGSRRKYKHLGHALATLEKKGVRK